MTTALSLENRPAAFRGVFSRVTRARLDLQGPLDFLDPLALADLQETRAKTDLVAPLESKVFQVVMDMRELPGCLESLVRMVSLGNLDLRALQDRREKLLLGRKVNEAWMDCLGLRETRVK